MIYRSNRSISDDNKNDNDIPDKKIKDVDINSLIIEDLAFLEYDEMVCITKESK